MLYRYCINCTIPCFEQYTVLRKELKMNSLYSTRSTISVKLEKNWKQNLLLRVIECSIMNSIPLKRLQGQRRVAVIGNTSTTQLCWGQYSPGATLGSLCVSSCGFCQCNLRSHYTIQRLCEFYATLLYSHCK